MERFLSSMVVTPELNLNARLIQIRDTPLAVITSVFFAARVGESQQSVVACRIVNVGAVASERRMDLHDGADVVHGVSSARPAIGQSILRRS